MSHISVALKFRKTIGDLQRVSGSLFLYEDCHCRIPSIVRLSVKVQIDSIRFDSIRFDENQKEELALVSNSGIERCEHDATTREDHEELVHLAKLSYCLLTLLRLVLAGSSRFTENSRKTVKPHTLRQSHWHIFTPASPIDNPASIGRITSREMIANVPLSLFFLPARLPRARFTLQCVPRWW